MGIRRDEILEFQGGSTRVVIGSDIIDDIGHLAQSLTGAGRGLIVTDENLRDDYAEPVQCGLNEAGIAANLVTLPPGDATKSLKSAEHLYAQLAKANVGRDGLVVAVGGGMVTDLAGFVAGTWCRGVASVLCPTTLEAHVDAAIGGKTAVNFAGGKNMVGLFHHPRLVVIDTDSLRTLSQRDLVAGLAESIKHAVITGESFTQWHEANVADVLARNDDALASLIHRNIQIKADHVARDERDLSGTRAMLNFGHTVGHAIESLADYRYRHGECVAIGMAAACQLSESMGLLASETRGRIVKMLNDYGLPTRPSEPIDVETVHSMLARDKKAAAGAVRFVLLEDLGRPLLRSDVPSATLLDALATLNTRT